MIINIHTPNPATLSTLQAKKKVKHWKLEHQVAFLCLDYLEFFNQREKSLTATVRYTVENSVGKPNMSISKTEFDPESINDSRWLKSISLYNFYVWSWCAVEISTPRKKSLTNVIW